MGFDSLLGNTRLKENLRTSVGRGHASHFYLLSGPEGSGKHTLAALLAAALLCQNEDAPCLQCGSCRKVLGAVHPDVITVEDPEHKTVAVRLVRKARADMYVMPNEGNRKIYIFPQELGVEGQNALLKILEEPPEYGVFLLLSDNPEKLLPTVRSRCTQLQLLPLPEDTLRQALIKAFPEADGESLRAAISRSGGYLGQAKTLLAEGAAVSPQTGDFVKSLSLRQPMKLLPVLVAMERWKRDQAIAEWQVWLQLLENALTCHGGQQTASSLARELCASCSVQELMTAVTVLQKAIAYAQSNVSVAAICGYLQWVLR